MSTVRTDLEDKQAAAAPNDEAQAGVNEHDTSSSQFVNEGSPVTEFLRMCAPR
jgi:hypothetical protein